MKLTICFIISAVLYTPTLGLGAHEIPDNDHGGIGEVVMHLAIGMENPPFCNVSSDRVGSKRRKIGKRHDIVLGKRVPNHSMVYFRGKTYEYGPSNWVLREGGLGRVDPLKCPVVSSKAGRSDCTEGQATRLAVWWQGRRGYHFYTHNCHYFADWLINKLTHNLCYDLTL
ncbi:uncharacterized protein LOC100893806 [Strongylocentrotus purpuratus]|uniref:LRAT domain-containing protein n=1 Tax=Strongylocentrotus purpuratus TaxID=7668 RepID=A0A7M7LPR6_STRPU|nr:uncharacterized protein LOC100893806 [Strongylocentrotus purpuratus]|eukprot:XP_003730632.1 PREDICTED: uncharacterized protein LOC100893806 [Strongylocentrotus purpuratus]